MEEWVLQIRKENEAYANEIILPLETTEYLQSSNLVNGETYFARVCKVENSIKQDWSNEVSVYYLFASPYSWNGVSSSMVATALESEQETKAAVSITYLLFTNSNSEVAHNFINSQDSTATVSSSSANYQNVNTNVSEDVEYDCQLKAILATGVVNAFSSTATLSCTTEQHFSLTSYLSQQHSAPHNLTSYLSESKVTNNNALTHVHTDIHAEQTSATNISEQQLRQYLANTYISKSVLAYQNAIANLAEIYGYYVLQDALAQIHTTLSTNQSAKSEVSSNNVVLHNAEAIVSAGIQYDINLDALALISNNTLAQYVAKSNVSEEYTKNQATTAQVSEIFNSLFDSIASISEGHYYTQSLDAVANIKTILSVRQDCVLAVSTDFEQAVRSVALIGEAYAIEMDGLCVIIETEYDKIMNLRLPNSVLVSRIECQTSTAVTRFEKRSCLKAEIIKK